MTLIVTSLRPHDLVLTADGRSVTRTAAAVTGVVDTFQKLFPVPDHPLVIAHHGENDLTREPLGRFVGDFIRQLNAGNFTVQEIADELRRYAHAAVRRRLKALEPGKNGCGFLVAGFGLDEREAGAVEVFWQSRPESLATEERRWQAVSVILSGDGQHQIDRPDWRRVADKPVEEVRKYNQSLVDAAIHANVEPNSVGGHVHELVVTREAWKWTIPPAEGK